MNTVTSSFKITVRQMANMSQQKMTTTSQKIKLSLHQTSLCSCTSFLTCHKCRFFKVMNWKSGPKDQRKLSREIFSQFRVLLMGSRAMLCTSCINSINKLQGATILR